MVLQTIDVRVQNASPRFEPRFEDSRLTPRGTPALRCAALRAESVWQSAFQSDLSKKKEEGARDGNPALVSQSPRFAVSRLVRIVVVRIVIRRRRPEDAAPRMPEAAETSHLTRHPSIDRIDRRARDEPSPPRESTHLFIRVGLARFARAASLARLARARRLARGVDLEATTATRAS